MSMTVQMTAPDLRKLFIIPLFLLPVLLFSCCLALQTNGIRGALHIQAPAVKSISFNWSQSQSLEFDCSSHSRTTLCQNILHCSHTVTADCWTCNTTAFKSKPRDTRSVAGQPWSFTALWNSNALCMTPTNKRSALLAMFYPLDCFGQCQVISQFKLISPQCQLFQVEYRSCPAHWNLVAMTHIHTHTHQGCSNLIFSFWTMTFSFF